MPIYEFECRKCGTRFEKLCGFSATDVNCAKCGETDVRKLMSMFSSVSKGSDRSSSSSSCGGCSKSSCSGCHH